MKKLLSAVILWGMLCALLSVGVSAATVQSVSLSGMGLVDNNIIIDLAGKSEVTQSYYLMTQPDILTKQECYVNLIGVYTDKYFSADCGFDEMAGLYKITITAKQPYETGFAVGFYTSQSGTSAYVLTKQINLSVEVIDSSGYSGDSYTGDYDRFAAKIRQAQTSSMIDAIRNADKTKPSVVSTILASDSVVSTGTLFALRDNPMVTVKVIDQNYYWTFNGSRIKSTNMLTTYNLTVKLSSNLSQKMSAASGAPKVVAFSIPSLGKLPGEGTLTLKTYSYAAGTKLNVYRYDNGSITTITTGCEVDAKNLISIPITMGGEYFYTTTNVK